ncbi:hypothetical protein DY000_02062106 [Brassica cretica]|uniref:RNase H type-1 domain-containing protein n=1 Tax=Brassica cretica TaxID=69181 RepID=A0ABQ7ARB8_BRACR|nr:hypothetical protein DY000_02062106 [Brassica cretica]
MKEQVSRPHRPVAQPQTPADAVTVRTDAAWIPVRNLAGLGWVVFSSPCFIPHKKHMDYVTSPLMAEGLALREAVRLSPLMAEGLALREAVRLCVLDNMDRQFRV